ncbi:ER membrane protein complex subunit 1 [Galendromus occidentalis]|uniref:ER membrane protein complex subunit 1 n=1 Tax=Galendromus occidentalis TaxID=34638 RepID=A0AAJ6VX90_9ACAR|nr:ER membrane protein complex subunit 1 [Galendromus occidentalis]
MFELKILLFSIGCLTCSGLFEDQVGKWDWLRKHVGPVKHVNFGTIAGGNIFVGTASNVLASINSRSGKLVWRKILQEDERGVIHSLSRRGNPILVTGSDPPILRSFHISGALHWETKLPSTPPKDSEQEHFIDAESMTVVSVYTSAKDVVVSQFSYASQETKTSEPISAPFARLSKCTLVDNSIYVCLVDQTLKVLALSDLARGFISSDLKTDASALELKGLPEGRFVAVRSKVSTWLYGVSAKGAELLRQFDDLTEITNFKHNDVVYQVLAKRSESSCWTLSVLDSKFSEVSELRGEICIPNVFSGIRTLDVMGLSKKDAAVSYRAVVTTDDAGVLMFQKEGRVVWSREEALSEVTNVQFVDLPLSDIEAHIEEEFTEKPTGVLSMLIKRIYSQLQQLATFFEPKNPLAKNFGLVRDNFGFHKVVFMATKVGKLFLVDNLSGDILWSRYLPNIRPFSNGQYITVTQRSTAHIPHPPVLSIFGRSPSGGSRVLALNPITGQILDDQHLDITITQYSLLQPNEEFLKGVVLYDETTRRTIVYPAKANTNYKHYLLTVGKRGVADGFLLEDGKIDRLWSIHLAAGSEVEGVAVKGQENVHSQGRVLGDRSVLYKYINPNLAAIISRSAQQNSVFVYLIDVVTGSIIYQTVHRKAKGPIHMVHSENWFVYSYINEKMRRQEISAIDLYEGFEQPNDTFSSFSSVQPQVEHNTFILPDYIVQLKDTVTEKGITSKLILAANAQGSILEIPKAMLDPRRPVNPTMLHREEGLIPYVPEILVPPQSILNYNQSVARVRGIETAPSGLESTCLVLAYGLDLYYTRVAPSQNFDILKDNFEHYFILVVLAALVTATYVTRALSARKALKAAWQ